LASLLTLPLLDTTGVSSRCRGAPQLPQKLSSGSRLAPHSQEKVIASFREGRKTSSIRYL
jgi:hypothetical protein